MYLRSARAHVDLFYLPLLQLQLDLYRVPPGRERFDAYLELMQSGSNDIALPITGWNPMAKAHANARLEALLTLNADAIGAEAAQEAAARLSVVPGAFRTALVLADDVGGGWTERHLTDARRRFESEDEVKRGFATGYLWTSEATTELQIREELLASIYRAAYVRRHRQARTLTQMLRQEGLAALFAGVAPQLTGERLTEAKRVIDSHLPAPGYPVAFACLYGDAAAVAAGYQPLGLPDGAGFAVALEAAREDGEDPVAVLI